MSIIKKMRKQKAVWWHAALIDHHGRPSFLPPVEIDCRWEDFAKDFTDAEGSRLISQSIVYVDRVVATGDRLKRGAIESSTNDDPLQEAEAYEVKRFEQLPNFKATEFLLVAYI